MGLRVIPVTCSAEAGGRQKEQEAAKKSPTLSQLPSGNMTDHGNIVWVNILRYLQQVALTISQ